MWSSVILNYEDLRALVAIHAKELGKKYVTTAVKNIKRAIELDAEKEANEQNQE